MKPNAYRQKVEKDLSDWIERGWVPASSREPILASLPKAAGGDGRGWIAMAATILAGLAVITFIGDNWAAIPRGLKLIMLLSLFGGTAVASGLLQETRKKTSNALALLSALIFSGSIALIGQAYNLPGEPDGAVFLSALGAALIGLAGRSAASSFAALVFGGIWIGMQLGEGQLTWLSLSFWGMNIVAGLVTLNAWLLRSRVLWHSLILSFLPLSSIHLAELSSLLTMGHLGVFSTNWDFDPSRTFGFTFLFITGAMWAALTAYGVRRDEADLTGGRTLAGYSAWFCLAAIALLGLPAHPEGDVIHRFCLLGASFLALWYGAKHHYSWIAAAGILSLLTGISILLVDIGMDMSAAAIIFAVTSAIALGVAYLLKKQASDPEGASQ